MLDPVLKYKDYYPFGAPMPGRNFNSQNYRFGFNGMEKDDEMFGTGNSYTTHFRQYDSRVVRWLSIDPVLKIFESPYVSLSNSPICNIDPNGDSDYYTESGNYLGSDGTNDMDIFVVTDKSLYKEHRKVNKQALKKNDYVLFRPQLNSQNSFKLPSYSDRQQIQGRVNSDNLQTEKGGFRASFKTLDPVDPIKNPLIEHNSLIFSQNSAPHVFQKGTSIYLSVLDQSHPNTALYRERQGQANWEYEWHSHYTYTETYANGDVGFTGKGPSQADLDNRQATNAFVLTPAYNAIYYYGSTANIVEKIKFGE